MKKTLRTFVAVEITGPIRARAEELRSEGRPESADSLLQHFAPKVRKEEDRRLT